MDIGNSEYFDVLLAEVPEKDLEGMKLTTMGAHLPIKKGQIVDEAVIAGVRVNVKNAFFMYKRKKAKWITNFNKI